ncbi:zinc-binding dehydrogenase [Trichoderma evansii]
MSLVRAVDVENGYGPATALVISSEIRKPEPGPGEALVKVKCFGINRMDLSQRNGQYEIPSPASKILGVEFSGEIVGLGDQMVNDQSAQDQNFQTGDEVFGLIYRGAYAEYVCVSTLMIIRKPKSISWKVAAGIPEVWITALQAMKVAGGFKASNSILWHAGASSVSIAGIQLSKALGASTIYATAGSEAKLSLCKGVDIIIDFVGQDYFQQNLNSAAKDGRVVIVGLLSGPKTAGSINLSPFVKQRIRVEGSRLRSRDLNYQKTLCDMLVSDVLPRIIDWTFNIQMEKVFDWHNIQAAHLLMESNTIMGKIVCKVT